MNILILGDGPDELLWARAVLDHPEHHLAASCPGFKVLPDVPGVNDLDAALASRGLDCVICGGDPALRSEGLRRAASTGLRAIALHPPGPNADPYYQVALSRQENGAIVVPDLPARLHPGVVALEKALRDDGKKSGRVVRYEATVGPLDGDLAGRIVPRLTDVVRAMIGEVTAVTATGTPSGESLTVHLRTGGDLHGEIRLTRGPHEPARLSVPAGDGSLTLEHDLAFDGPARLLRRSAREGESVIELGSWDAKAAILRALEDADPSGEATPGLGDGTRAMEVAEAAARSLRKGRTIDLHYEEMSEVGNFKSVMTSTGCALLLIAMILLFASAAAPWLGFEKGAYIAWIVPPALVLFVIVQFLRYGIKAPGARSS